MSYFAEQEALLRMTGDPVGVDPSPEFGLCDRSGCHSPARFFCRTNEWEWWDWGAPRLPGTVTRVRRLCEDHKRALHGAHARPTVQFKTGNRGKRKA